MSRRRVIAKLERGKRTPFYTGPSGRVAHVVLEPFEVTARADGLGAGETRGIGATWTGAVKVRNPGTLEDFDDGILTGDHHDELTTDDVNVLASRWLKEELEEVSVDATSLEEFKRKARVATEKFLARFDRVGLQVTRSDGLEWRQDLGRGWGPRMVALTAIAVAGLGLGSGFGANRLGILDVGWPSEANGGSTADTTAPSNPHGSEDAGFSTGDTSATSTGTPTDAAEESVPGQLATTPSPYTGAPTATPTAPSTAPVAATPIPTSTVPPTAAPPTPPTPAPSEPTTSANRIRSVAVSWCSTAGCAPAMFGPLIEGSGYDNPNGVKFQGGACYAFTLPAGIQYDIWDGVKTTSGQSSSGNFVLPKVCEASFRGFVQ